MKLRTKIVSLILVIFLGYLGTVLLIQKLVILPSFVSLEREKAAKNVERCRDALAREIAHLKVQCQDWASWDDSYEFVLNVNQEYISDTLMVESFDNVELNLIYYISPSGDLVWGKVYDLSNAEPVEIEPVLDNLAKYPGLLVHDSTESAECGIVITRHGPMLIASLPILTTENEGPVRGALLMGRLLTDDIVEQIAGQTKIDLRICPVDDPSLSAAARSIIDDISEYTPVSIIKDGQHLDGYTVYRDINGVPILLIRAHLPSDIIARGVSTMSFARLSIVGAGLVTLLLLLIAMQRIVIEPLNQLTRHSCNVGETSNLSSKLNMKRSDEIGVLADTLDRMIDQLAQSQMSLADASRAAGKADVASRILHNVGNVLNSVNISADAAASGLSGLPIDDLGKVAEMLSDNVDYEGRYLADDPKGQLIPGYLGELYRQFDEDRGQLSEELRTLIEQVNHIKSIIASQQGDAKATRVEEIGSLQNAVDDALKMNSDLIGRWSVHVSRSYDDLPAVRFDRHQLMDVVVNLVSNAVHALENKSDAPRELKVAIRASEYGDQALVEIADNGEGIEADNMTRIFTHGFTTRANGHGFGLHSAALTAKGMGGSLTGQSDGPGQGAIFTLTIPIRTTEAIVS